MATKKKTSREVKKPAAAQERRSVGANLPESDPQKKPFTPEVLDRTTIAIPLLEKLKHERDARKTSPGEPPLVYPVIIDLHLEYPGGRERAKGRVRELVN